jgi:hypothetical protein
VRLNDVGILPEEANANLGEQHVEFLTLTDGLIQGDVERLHRCGFITDLNEIESLYQKTLTDLTLTQVLFRIFDNLIQLIHTQESRHRQRKRN